MSICEKCGTEYLEEKCPNCEKIENVTPVEEKQETVKPKKKTGLIVGIAAAVVAVIAVVCLVLFLPGGGSGKNFEKYTEKYTVFIKDNEAYYLDAKEDKPVLIADNIFKDEEDASYGTGNGFKFVQDGKKVFYPQKIELEGGTFALYCRNLSNPEEMPVKIAEGVVKYSVSEDGNTVIYRDIDNNLYTHDMVERTKILSGVDSYWVSGDCTKLLYLSTDGGLYTQLIAGEKDKIDGDVSSVIKVNDDLSEIYYFKENTGGLFLQKADGEKVVIDKNVSRTSVRIIGNGVYFTKAADSEDAGTVTESDTVTLYDFIEDPKDLIESDAAMDDSASVSTWNEKLYRDWTRKELKDRTPYISKTTPLYYYNGTEVISVCTTYGGTHDRTEDAILVRAYAEDIAFDKININDFVDTLDEHENFRSTVASGTSIKMYTFMGYDYFDEFEKQIEDAYARAATYYLVKDGVMLEIPHTEDVYDEIFVSPKSDKVYYYTNFDEETETADLRVIPIVDGAVGTEEVYVTGIELEYEFDEFDRLYHIANYREEPSECFDLYVDNVLVEYDIAGFETLSDGRILYYTADYEEAYLYNKDGTKEKLTNDFKSVFEGENATIYYLNNYSEQSRCADLYVYRNGESLKIDYDVERVIQVNPELKYMSVTIFIG